MSGELRPGTLHRPAVLRHLFWGALLVILCYHLATWALLIILGPDALVSSPNLNYTLVLAVGRVLGKPWGIVTAICLMQFFLVSPLVYCLASSRILILGSLDQRLPAKLSSTNASRVPVAAFWIQSGFAILLLGTIFLIAPAITSFGSPANLASVVYNIVLATLTIIFMVATLFLFVNLFLVLHREKRLATQRILPRPLLWISGVLGAIVSLLVIGDTIWNSFIPQLLPNALWTLAVGLCFIFCSVIVIIFSVLASGEAASQRLIRLSQAQHAR